MCNFFGGASSAEQGNAAAETSLAKSLQADFGTRFGEQSKTMQDLTSVISQIQSGNTGPGFGATEEAARTSNIINQGAAEARNVQQAVADKGAGQAFGSNSSGQASAIRQQLNQKAASAASADTSNALIKNTAENYQQGRINAAQTAGGLESLAGIENPDQLASMASGANEGAFKMNNEINKENTSGGLFGSLLTAGVGLAGKFISGGMSGLGPGGEGNTNVGDFFKGGISGAFGG